MSFIRSLFSVSPGPNFSYYTPMFILIILLVAASLTVGQIYKSKKQSGDIAFKRLFKNVSRNLFLFALLFGFLLVVRYENIPYFSMRILLYAAIVGFLYYAYVVIQRYRLKYPKEQERQSNRSVKEDSPKYTAKKKRK